MKATKYTVTIRMEMLSKDVIPSLISDAMALLEREISHAELNHDDGDCVCVLIQEDKVVI